MAQKRTKNNKERSSKTEPTDAQPSGNATSTNPDPAVRFRGQPPRQFRVSDLIAASGQEAQPITTSPAAGYRQVPSVNLKFKDTIRVINEMQEAGAVSRYAIGGAVGATFYLEPVRTFDIDIFIPVHQEPGSLIIKLAHHDYLKAHGYTMKGEYWQIEGSLVQFLPLKGSLMEEAVTQAREFLIEGVRTFVFSAEHLVAIALQLGRPKDRTRIVQFIDEDVLDKNRLLEILKRHNLLEKWDRFREKFLGAEL
jgi:hypothetical protein